MNFIKKHKIAIIVFTICLILFVIASITMYKLMFPSNEDINGDRTIGDPGVDSAVIAKILGELKENKIVVDATYNKNVRILKFFIDTKEKTKLDKAKKLTDIIYDNLNEDVRSYYDIEVYLTQKNNENYPAIGYCFKGNDYFSWNYNGVGKDE